MRLRWGYGLGLLGVLLACQWLSPSYWLQRGLEQVSPTVQSALSTVEATVIPPSPAMPTSTISSDTTPEMPASDLFTAPEVQSFRFRFTQEVRSPALNSGQPLTVMAVDLAVRRTPALRVHGTMQGGLGAMLSEFYQIDDSVYLLQGGTWLRVPTSEAPDFTSYLAVLDEFSDQWPEVGRETINDIPAVHYHIEVETPPVPAMLTEAAALPSVPLEQVQVARFVGDVYLADPGGWPVRQEARWEGQVTLQGQTVPAVLVLRTETWDVNADFDITLPPEVTQQTGETSTTPPIPLPEGAKMLATQGTDEGQMGVYQVPVSPMALWAFWEQHPEVTLGPRMGADQAYVVSLTYGGRTFSVTVSGEGESTRVVISWK